MGACVLCRFCCGAMLGKCLPRCPASARALEDGGGGQANSEAGHALPELRAEGLDEPALLTLVCCRPNQSPALPPGAAEPFPHSVPWQQAGQLLLGRLPVTWSAAAAATVLMR